MDELSRGQAMGSRPRSVEAPNKSSLGIADPTNLAKRGIPKDDSLSVTEIIPRLKDVGAFAKFTHPPAMTAEQIETELFKVLAGEGHKGWFSPFQEIQVALAKWNPMACSCR